jgi:serine/threonine protein kinase
LISFTNDNSGKGTVFEKPDEDNVRFVLAGIILGLEYLHKLGIVLNDLKL